MNINSLFNLLDDWRCLPAYQLERRADVFFALHLEEILKEKLHGAKIDIIIPEFPIRKGSLSQDPLYNINPETGKNQSFKIDYLAYSKSKNLVYLIELKTDVSSRNLKQDWYLKESQKLGMYKILDDLKPIHKASNKTGRKKYEHLFKKLNYVGLISGADTSFEVPKTEIKTQIVYIQPTKKEGDIDFDKTISFKDIIDSLREESNTALTERFLESLENWQTDCKR